ncbi:immune inhibitor A [Endozoicomonas sp. SM1973]|uniref:Immune inhibitor A n=1 Tax=Spartinivicinus marinus TaxID=2994442 RepID=A0A853II79_9GAMM|nr:immune inhibitor A domain-containing protein [Spartinivicinus marinus]MCX4029592.1 immune inhibitor A [Spartinivicinus marinus]NYZ68805.1 immune inhibitor A [Spartinivicinus marinus]
MFRLSSISLLASSLMVGAACAASPTLPHSTADLAIADEVGITKLLKKTGRLNQDASPAEASKAVLAYLKETKSKTLQMIPGELDRQALTRHKQRLKQAQQFQYQQTGQLPTYPGQLNNQQQTQQYQGKKTQDKVLALLIEFPDYKHNEVGPEDTERYYPDYNIPHYTRLLFSDSGYSGPNQEKLISMRQYYEQQSGNSYSVDGQVVGWYMAKNPAKYYGEGRPDPKVPDLVREALAAAAQDPNIDLTQFDQEDRYDYDNDGDLREPDGIIDHLMVFHSSVGQESGGGDLGENAIWSHRSNLRQVYKIPGSEMSAYDYTIQPIDAAAGVCAHEYAHDLGLPDEYDTHRDSKGEPIAYWSIMSSGSHGGKIRGTEPTGFSPWARQYLQANLGGNWLSGTSVNMDELNRRGLTFLLDQANEKAEYLDVVRVNLPPEKVVVNQPYQGEKEYFSGRGDELNQLMSIELDLTTAQAPVLEFKAWYQIEQDYDYARILVNGTPIPGNLTTHEDPHEIGHGWGITGNSDGWVDVSFDLSKFRGHKITLSFNYLTDVGTSEAGFYVDDITIIDNDQLLLEDNAEGDSVFTMQGFAVDPGYFMADQYYLLEWRNHEGVDQGLKHINFNRELMTYDPGLVVWFANDKYTNNWVGVHPGEGFLGVVDADQSVLRWEKESDAQVASTRFQMRDAALSLTWQQSPLNLTSSDGYTLQDHQLYNTATFFDLFDYMNKEIPDAGRILPKYGLLIEVIDQAEDMSAAAIRVSYGLDDNTAQQNQQEIQQQSL